MSWRMASNTTLNCASYFFSNAADFPASCVFDASIWRSRTKARMISMLTWIARRLLSTDESMAIPCSVNAYGAARLEPPQLEITICDFKFTHFSRRQLKHEIARET